MRIGVTLGDPSGIGAEIALRLIQETGPAAPVTFFGSETQMEAGAAALGMAPPLPVRVLGEGSIEDGSAFEGSPALVHLADLDRTDVRPGVPTPAGAGAQLRYVSVAAKQALEGRIDAIVTCPVSKAAISSVMGRRFVGQTELLARLAGVRTRDVAMAFTGDKIHTALVTTHLALRDVPKALSAERIAKVCNLEIEHLRLLGIEQPRLAIAALNPHAGERGLFGDEELKLIAPAIGGIEAQMRASGRSAVLAGPYPADVAYRRHVEGRFDAVIAMYHDQAMIACRLLAFGRTVNTTLGLPYVRTSVDHGTAYDIAGAGRADASSMLAAYRLARKLVRTRAAPGGGESA